MCHGYCYAYAVTEDRFGGLACRIVTGADKYSSNTPDVNCTTTSGGVVSDLVKV